MYTVSFYSFHLLDGEKKINSESLISREDCLPGEISPNSTAEGYVYFNADKKDTYKLEYVAIGNGKKNTYLFDIK